MSGSDSLENSIDFMVDKLKSVNLENVHTENASVPYWKRGYESASMIKPYFQKLQIFGLGSTIGTPKGGIKADVLVVENFTEFNSLPDSMVMGKIVVFVPKWESYYKTVIYRREAASVAASKGAVAALVKSITPFSLGTPHTGMQHYQDNVKKIPVASLIVEDAEKFLRIYRRGIVMVVLRNVYNIF